MNVRTCVIIFFIFSFGCDAKSVSCDNGSNSCENSIEKEINNRKETIVPKKKKRLEELKENVGKVGNKLEGIVYEVLKDILKDDYDSSAEILNGTDQSNMLVKETETATELFLSKLHPAYLFNDNDSSSVIEDDVVLSSKTDKPKITKQSNSNENSSNNNKLSVSNIPSNGTISEMTTLSNMDNNIEVTTGTTMVVKDSNSESNTKHSSNERTTPQSTKTQRKRRMIQENPELSRSVENFMESNPEKNTNTPRMSPANHLEEPVIFIRDIPSPRQEMRKRSKDDTVTRDPKREPTEDNKSKKPQDDMNMRNVPMSDDFLREGEKTRSKNLAHREIPEHNIVDSSKRGKLPSENQRSARRKTPLSEGISDIQFQNHQEMKEASRANQELLNQRSNSNTQSDFQFPKETRHSEEILNQRTSSDISDFQFPVHLEMKKGPSKNDEILIQRINPEKSNFSPSRHSIHQNMKQVLVPDDGTINQKNEENSQEIMSDSRLGQSYVWGGNQPSNCYEKNNREEILEKQHIEDLKYEVSKLRSVVDLLKEQQRLINSFDGDKKTMNTQEMMGILNQLNQKKEKPVKLDESQKYEVDTATKKKHEELGLIKVQLKDAIDNLNRTKEILNLEHQKEMNLETELKTQKTEINWLKLIIENFIISQAKKKIKDEPSEVKVIEDEVKPVNDTSLVGAINPTSPQKKTHNRTIPSTVKMAEEKLMELERMRSRESSLNDSRDREINRQLKNLNGNSPKARASSMSNLEKLLDNLNDKQSKSDDDDSFQTKLFEAMKELRKKKDEETSIKDLVRKLQMNSVESKSEDDMLFKFQRALKALDGAQSKSDDLDIEDQLKVLQREINKLKATDDISLLSGELKSPADDNTQLQLMLSKLIANNPQLQGMKLPPISPQQLIQLQKKFGKVPTGIVPPIMGGVGMPGDFGSTQAAFPSTFGKVQPLYGPFGPGLGSYSSIAYAKDLDATSSIGNYSPSYGLGQDLSKIMPYRAPPTNSYAPNHGYTGSNYYSGNNGYFAGNGYAEGASYGSVPTSGSGYSTHSSNYPMPSSGLYGASKPSYGVGVVPPYTNIYSAPYKTPYGKPQDVSYAMNPYSGQPLTYSNPTYDRQDPIISDKQSYGNNNFFQITQPSSYGSGPPAPYLPPKTIDTSGPEKVYGNQPPYTSATPQYPTDKIDELKTQIYALQNAISTYNRPEYTQTAEDKSTIHNLELQIEELKGIVNSLNGYPGDQQNFGSPGATQYEPLPYSASNDPKNAEGYNRDSDKKVKRETQDQDSSQEQKIETNETRMSINKKTQDHSGLWDKIISIFQNNFSSDSASNKRRRRSVNDNSIEDNSSSNMMDKLTTVLREVLEDEPDTQPQRGLGVVPMPMNSISRTAENLPSNAIPKQTSLQDIKKQIDHLKKQLGSPKSADESSDKLRSANISPQTTHASSRHAILPEPSYGFNYALNPFASDLSVKPKKLDIFKEIVAKIMDKVIESLPVILQKLFGFAVHELTAYGDDYGASYGADSSYLAVFRNLGIFGYLPLILLRLVNAVSTFIYILQKNKFLKYFLVPAGVVLLVTGGMVFLIWWMQPGDFYINYDKLSYDKDTSYGNDYYSGDYGKGSRQIMKTYGIEDGKSRLHTYNHGEDSKSLQSNTYPAFYKPNLVVPSDNQVPAYNE